MYKEYLQKLENLKGKELKGKELKSERIDLTLSNTTEQVTYELEVGNRDFMTDYMAKIEVAIKNGQKELNRLKGVLKLAKNTEERLKDALKNVGVDKSPLLSDLQKQINKFENMVLKESKKYYS